ncbi:MAG: flagellar biosynthesis protein FlgJ [Gammaproteobacteria bacterium]|nr:flagellar biosynthesis protein FlgJ [Gammaproteobacteria bacterium]
MNARWLYVFFIINSLFFSVALKAQEKITAQQASVFDYSQVRTVAEKKRIFFSILRPIILSELQLIAEKRQRIIRARDKGDDILWIKQLATEYKIQWDDSNPDWDQLLLRVDGLPVDLIMVQAANESAWGLSRFARQGNNLFGQWCFSKGCGLVPGQRTEGARHEVRRFSSINESITSYVHNINTFGAYRELRNLRGQLREQDKPLDAIFLAQGLKQYSSRGMAYVEEIQSMIRSMR